MYYLARPYQPLPRPVSRPQRALGATLDTSSLALLLLGGAIGALLYAKLYGKGSSARTACPVSNEDWNEINQKYDYRVGTEDYWMDRATKGMSDEDVEDAIDAAGEAGMKRVKKHWREDEIVI